MSSLTVASRTADGRRAIIDGDVLEIDRRLKEGDPTVGWSGDPGLWLEWDRLTETFVVCRRDPDTGMEADVTRWKPPLTVGLLIRLRDGDTRRAGNDPMAAIDAANEAHERDLDREFEAKTDETAARFAHAMKRSGVDVGYSQRTSFSGTGLWTPGAP